MSNPDPEISFPSISEDGWVTAPLQKGDYMLSHFILNERSQSYLYDGNIVSLPGLVQRYKDDISGLATNTQQQLFDQFSRYFTNVVVETENTADADDPSKYTLSIYVSYDDQKGQRYNVGQAALITNSKVEKIILANNGTATAV